MFVEANTNHLFVQSISHHTQYQVLPYLVKKLGVVVVFWILELDKQTTTFRPSLPWRFTMFLEKHDLDIDIAFGGQFDWGVVEEEMLKVLNGSDECWFIVLLIVGVDSPTFGVEAPGFKEEGLSGGEGVFLQLMVAIVCLCLLLHSPDNTAYHYNILLSTIIFYSLSITIHTSIIPLMSWLFSWWREICCLNNKLAIK